VHHVDQVALCGHDRVNILVGHRYFIDAAGVLATLHALGGPNLVFHGKHRLRLGSRHHRPRSVATATVRVGVALSANNEALRPHRPWNDAHFSGARTDRSLSGDPHTLTKVGLLGDVVVVAVNNHLHPCADGPLDGMANPEGSPAAQQTAMFSAMGTAAMETFKPSELAESGGKYALDWMVNRVATGNFDFESADIGSFMVGYARNRTQHLIAGTGQVVQDQRTSQMAAEVFAANLTHFENRADVNGLPSDAARAHFQAFLSTGVVNHDNAFVEWQSSWNRVSERLTNRIANVSNPMEAERYKAWVLSDPAKVSERLTFSVTEVSTAAFAADTTADAITASERFGALSLEQQGFYRAYLASPDRIAVGNQEARMDVRTTSGGTDFNGAFAATKRAMMLTHLRDELAELTRDQQNAFSTWLETANPDRDLPVLDPSNPATTQQAAELWFQRRQETLALQFSAESTVGN
jgi:hypothetical protein